jgi:hypothetical protein
MVNIGNDYTRLPEPLFLIQNAHRIRGDVSVLITLLCTNDIHSLRIQESLDL